MFSSTDILSYFSAVITLIMFIGFFCKKEMVSDVMFFTLLMTIVIMFHDLYIETLKYKQINCN